MKILEERGIWRRFLTSSIVAWVSLAVSIAALVVSLRHPNQDPPKQAAKVPVPPDGFLLDPRKAKVADARGSAFSWHDDNEDKIEGDHFSYGGWEADGDRLDFVSYAVASIRGVMKFGIVALAHPDENRLHIEWPIKVKAGQTLQFTCCLTDRAVQLTRRGAKIRVELSRKGLSSKVLADEEELKPGDEKVIEITQPLAGNENKLVLEIDNCGSEFWSTVYCNARVK